MPRLAVVLVAAVLLVGGCGPDAGEQADVYTAALRHVVDVAGERPLFVLEATCEGAGGSRWADQCGDEIPEEVRRDVAERLRGVAPVVFVDDLRRVRISRIGFVQQGGALVLLGPITFEDDTTATVGINWADESPEVFFHREMVSLARSGGAWRVVGGSGVGGSA